MRKLYPVAGAAILLGGVGIVSAQVPVTMSAANSAPTTNFGAINLNTMLPNINVNRALIAPNNTSRKFDFSKLLPNFGYVNNRFPTQRAGSQIDAKYFYPFFQPKK